MRSVALISDRPFNLLEISDAYLDLGRVVLQSATRLVVQRGSNWFAFDLDDRIESMYDDEELRAIRKHVPDPYFVSLSFHDTPDGANALSHFPVEGIVLVDNEYGLLTDIAEMRRRIHAGLEWERVSE